VKKQSRPLGHAADKWRDRAFVRVWDAQPTNLLKAEQLDILVAVMAGSWRRGSRVLNLGCGTGKLEALALRQLPDARFTSVDRSEVMLELAQERLSRYPGSCRFIQADLGRLDKLKLSGPAFRFITTVDVVHELTPAAQKRLFRFCRSHLGRDGLLLILDRVALDLEHLRRPLGGVLHRLQKVTSSRTGQLSDCFVDPRHDDHEHPLALDAYLTRLRRAGFATAVLHHHLHKTLIAAALDG
jgi:SAM-dependent methyltransferase